MLISGKLIGQGGDRRYLSCAEKNSERERIDRGIGPLLPRMGHATVIRINSARPQRADRNERWNGPSREV
jgi:hypothetical protein